MVAGLNPEGVQKPNHEFDIVFGHRTQEIESSNTVTEADLEPEIRPGLIATHYAKFHAAESRQKFQNLNES